MLGCLAFVVGMSVVAYRCYRRYGSQSDGGENRLSSAIKKGLKEQSNSSMRKSPSLKSAAASTKGHGSMGISPAMQVIDAQILVFLMDFVSCSDSRDNKALFVFLES